MTDRNQSLDNSWRKRKRTKSDFTTKRKCSRCIEASWFSKGLNLLHDRLHQLFSHDQKVEFGFRIHRGKGCPMRTGEGIKRSTRHWSWRHGSLALSSAALTCLINFETETFGRVYVCG